MVEQRWVDDDVDPGAVAAAMPRPVRRHMAGAQPAEPDVGLDPHPSADLLDHIDQIAGMDHPATARIGVGMGAQVGIAHDPPALRRGGQGGQDQRTGNEDGA
jgi:hypothetical protein